MTVAESERLLTVSDVADKLRVSKPTVYALLKRGLPKPFYLTPANPRWRSEEINRYLAAQAIAAQEQQSPDPA